MIRQLLGLQEIMSVVMKFIATTKVGRCRREKEIEEKIVRRDEKCSMDGEGMKGDDEENSEGGQDENTNEERGERSPMFIFP